MLMRMYMMWAEKNGYKVTEQDYQEGEVAGIKSVTLRSDGDLPMAISKEKMAYIAGTDFSIRFECPQAYFFCLCLCLSFG
jgi:protein subunit release factor B